MFFGPPPIVCVLMRNEKSLREINRQSEPCNVMNRDKLELDDVTKLTTREVKDVTKLTTREVEDVTKLTNREMEEVPKLTTRELEDVTTVFRQFERGPREGCIDVKVGRFELFTKGRCQVQYMGKFVTCILQTLNDDKSMQKI